MDLIRDWFYSGLEWFTEPSVSISVTDVLEILILAFLVYNLLLWIKTTRAWTLLKGIMILLVCVMIVYILRMDTLIFIVNRGIDILVTATIVIFQPELRKALEQLGEKQIVSSLIPIDTGKNTTERFSDRTVNEIVKACVEMGKAKTGALIVSTTRLSMTELLSCGATGSRQLPVICLFQIICFSVKSWVPGTEPAWGSARQRIPLLSSYQRKQALFLWRIKGN